MSASVTGLVANTEYHFRISAANAGGTSGGSDERFKTLSAANAPAVVTEQASAVTHTLATLNASVNPNGATVSDCRFEYGTTEAYGSTVPCASLPGSGGSSVAVYASLGSLSGNTTYHFRISAANPNGESTGSDQTFTTLAALPTPHWYRNGVKTPLDEKLPTIAWGTLTLESSAGNVMCHAAEAANVENTAGAARQETVAFATWECKAIGGECAAGGHEARMTPRGLPWLATTLEEGEEASGEFRQEASGVEIADECWTGGIKTGNLLFKTGPVLTETGTMSPKVQNGSSAGKPSEIVFTGEPGHLYAESEGSVAIKGTTKGQLKVEVYSASTPIPLITLGKP